MEEVADVVRTNDVADAEQNKAMGILAYIGILFIVPLIAAKESPFAKYHANQGLILFLFGLATAAICVIPVLGWIVGGIGSIVQLVFAIIGIINAANGKKVPLPVIGGIKLIN